MRGRPFQPGNKIGRGRPRGSRNKTSIGTQELLNQFSEPLVKKAFAEAFKGDKPMMRLLLERILPGRRGVPTRLGALATRTAEDVSKASESVVKQVTSGKVSALEANVVLDLLEKRRRAIETGELEKRLRLLESKS